MNHLRHFYTAAGRSILRVPAAAYLTIIAALATVLRLLSIVKSDLWHDEAYTAMLINFSPSEIIARVTNDFHPPLYYLTLHVWSQLFGTSVLSLRGLSLVCGVGVVVLLYFIMKRLKFGEKTARLAVLFAAFAPFLIRYSQEARMYEIAALLVCGATLALLVALDHAHKGQTKYWIIYGLLMSASLYTHYYTAFIVFVHVGYTWYRSGSLVQMIKNKRWWLGNLIPVTLFGLWVPVALSQFQRVQAGYWIPPVNTKTIPDTFMQFLTFASNLINPGVEFLIMTALIIAMTALVLRAKRSERPAISFVTAWLAIPLLIAFGISIVRQPVYYDRYFIYSAAAWSCLLAIMALRRYKAWWLNPLLIAAILAVSVYGISQVAQQAGHRMASIAHYVGRAARPGDFIVSGTLYTYFDFSYYNHSGLTLHLLAPNGIRPTAETGLIYDKRQQIVVHNYNDIAATGARRVWLVGKTGIHDYDTTLIPKNWQLDATFQDGSSSVRLYEILPH